jgi:hypothetical protein
MRLPLLLSEQMLQILLTGKTIQGSIHAERVGNEVVIGFRPYRRNSTGSRRDQTLLTLPHGSIRKSRRRYKLFISVPDTLGERRCGELMKCESEEAKSFMDALESVLNAV